MLAHVVRTRLQKHGGKILWVQLHRFNTKSCSYRYNIDKAIAKFNQYLKDNNINLEDLQQNILAQTTQSETNHRVLYTDNLPEAFKTLKMEDISTLMKNDPIKKTTKKGEKGINKKKQDNVMNNIDHDINLIDKNTILFQYFNDYQLAFNDSVENLNILYQNLANFDMEKAKQSAKDKVSKDKLNPDDNCLDDIDSCLHQFLIKSNESFDNIDWDPIKKLIENSSNLNIEISDKFVDNNSPIPPNLSNTAKSGQTTQLFKLKLVTDFLINEAILEIERINSYSLVELNALVDFHKAEQLKLRESQDVFQSKLNEAEKANNSKELLENWPNVINNVILLLRDSIFQKNRHFFNKPMAFADQTQQNENNIPGTKKMIDITKSMPLWCFHLQQLLIVLENLHTNIPQGWKLFVDVNKLLELLEIVKTLDQPRNNVKYPRERQFLHLIKSKTFFTICNLIYLKTNNFTLDPINESEYINALIEFNQCPNALSLFKKSKAEINQRWWWDLGLTIYLSQNNLTGFCKLLHYYDKLFNNKQTYRYLTAENLKLSIRKFSKISTQTNNQILTSLLDRCIEMIRGMGIHSLQMDPNKETRLIQFQTEQEAFDHFNKLQKLTYNDLVYILNLLCSSHHYQLIFDFWRKLKKVTYYYENGWKKIDLEHHEFAVIKLRIEFYKDYHSIVVNLTKGKSITPSEGAKLEKIFEKYDKLRNPKEIDLFFDTCHKLFTDHSNYGNSPIITILTKKMLILYKKTEEIAKSKQTDESMKNKLSLQSNIILKGYLTQGELRLAFEFLNELENTKVVQAHHYASFLSFFIKKARLIKYQGGLKKSVFKSKLIRFEKQVIEFIQKISEFDFVMINSTILLRLLYFYLEVGDYERCFNLIADIFGQKYSEEKKSTKTVKANGIDKEKINTNSAITEKLYHAIWVVYLNHYKKFITVPSIINKTDALNAEYSIRQVLNRMINVDNILPGIKLVDVIIRTFIANNDWEALPAIISQFGGINGIEFPDYITRKILEMIRQKRISILVDRDLAVDPRLNQFDLKNKYSKEIKSLNLPLEKLARNIDKNETIVLREMFRLLREINPYDFNFNNVRKAFEQLGIPINEAIFDHNKDV